MRTRIDALETKLTNPAAPGAPSVEVDKDLAAMKTEVANLRTALQSLDLSGTNVTNVEALAGLAALRALDLSRTPVANIAALKELAALRELNLWGT